MKSAGAGWLLLLVFSTSLCLAQWRSWRRYSDGPIYYTEGGVEVDERTVRTAREVTSHSTATPVWTNDPAFLRDGFTFVRIVYSRNFEPGISRSAGEWLTDFPDSDLSLSYRLQQMTSIKVDPDGRILRLTSKELFDYPWIYMVEPGGLSLSREEAAILRKYLLNGGFLMADDFWGEVQWRNFYERMKEVFPELEPEELPMDHAIFHCVFDIRLAKNQMQIPNYRTGERSQYNDGITWEYHDGEECREVHYQAIFDDKRRMMVMICHNTDDGDGWEREGEYKYFFREFSEKKAYPLGINIIFYAMTH